MNPVRNRIYIVNPVGEFSHGVRIQFENMVAEITGQTVSGWIIPDWDNQLLKLSWKEETTEGVYDHVKHNIENKGYSAANSIFEVIKGMKG